MRKNYMTLFIAIITTIAGLQAQTLYVKETNSVQNVYSLSSVKKLTFPSGDSISVKTNTGITTYSLSIVRYFNFTNITTGISQNAIQKEDMFLFPNPVSDEFQISYQTEETGVLQIEIIDVQGKKVLQQTLSNQYGKNLFIINVSQLSQGLYICRVQNGSRFENVKFIKN